jgi:inorganic pyrophosphatase
MDAVVVVEIPKGERNKYEVDHTTGEVWLDRTLFTSMRYPCDYGFFPDTLGEDGDPLDALVLLGAPTFPGCHIHVRVVALFEMTDESGPDAKLVVVPATDPRWLQVRDLDDVDQFLRDEIGQFFEVYKLLEPGKHAVIEGWRDRVAAERELQGAYDRAAAAPHTP